MALSILICHGEAGLSNQEPEPIQSATLVRPDMARTCASVRFSGRQLRMRVEGDQLAAWRVGTMRLDVKAGGNR